MSRSKKTGKYTQSKHDKISMNMKPPFKEMLEEIRIKSEAVKGEPITRTQAIEEAIYGFHALLKLSEEKAMKQHERREVTQDQLEQLN